MKAGYRIILRLISQRQITLFQYLSKLKLHGRQKSHVPLKMTLFMNVHLVTKASKLHKFRQNRVIRAAALIHMQIR